MATVIRLILPLIIFAMCAFLVITHGIRGVVILVAMALASALPRTRAWRVAEAILVRLTGSRRGALKALMFTIVGCVAAFEVYQIIAG